MSGMVDTFKDTVGAWECAGVGLLAYVGLVLVLLAWVTWMSGMWGKRVERHERHGEKRA